MGRTGRVLWICGCRETRILKIDFEFYFLYSLAPQEWQSGGVILAFKTIRADHSPIQKHRGGGAKDGAAEILKIPRKCSKEFLYWLGRGHRLDICQRCELWGLVTYTENICVFKNICFLDFLVMRVHINECFLPNYLIFIMMTRNQTLELDIKLSRLKCIITIHIPGVTLPLYLWVWVL